jgi:hypothetical protein
MGEYRLCSFVEHVADYDQQVRKTDEKAGGMPPTTLVLVEQFFHKLAGPFLKR